MNTFAHYATIPQLINCLAEGVKLSYTKTSSIAIVRKITKCIEKLHPDAATQKKLFHKSHPKGRLIRLLATSSCWNLNKVKVYYRL